MYQFSREQLSKALFYLVVFHIIIIASSNYLVQFAFTIHLPFSLPILGNEIHNTWGAFTFPFIFLATDLTVRIFGKSLARKIIFCVMFPALAISYFISVVFHDGSWVGLEALNTFNIFVGRIALASFSAYIVGQLLDITVFNRLRQLPSWWVAPSASAIFGNTTDTLVFFFIAFYHSSDPFMASHWFDISLADLLIKMSICALFFLPAYGILLNYLIRKLTELDQKRQAKKAVTASIY